MQRPALSELLPVQIKTVLDFVNQAETVDDLTNIEKHRPDLPPEELKRYSIGETSAQNILDARPQQRGGQFTTIEQLLAVKGIGEDKVLDIVEFIWLPAEEEFRKHLFASVLGENWEVNYWRTSFDTEEEYTRIAENEAELRDFVAKQVLAIGRKRHDNYLVGVLARDLLEKLPMDRFDGGGAVIQFASWWYRFDEDNWFSFERIREVIDPFLNYFGKQRGAYIDLVFFRGFQAGVVAKGISPDDLVVTLNPTESSISIWGISLFD